MLAFELRIPVSVQVIVRFVTSAGLVRLADAVPVIVTRAVVELVAAIFIVRPAGRLVTV